MEGGTGPDLLRPRPQLRIVPGKLGGSPHVEHTRLETLALASRGPSRVDHDRADASRPQPADVDLCQRREWISSRAPLKQNLLAKCIRGTEAMEHALVAEVVRRAGTIDAAHRMPDVDVNGLARAKVAPMVMRTRSPRGSRRGDGMRHEGALLLSRMPMARPYNIACMIAFGALGASQSMHVQPSNNEITGGR